MVCPQEFHGRLTLFILRCQCAWDAPATDNPQFDCPIRYHPLPEKLFFEHPSSPFFFPEFKKKGSHFYENILKFPIVPKMVNK